MSFLGELKRRNVIRVAVAYLVVSWLVLQVADVVFPALHLPEWSITLVTVLLGLGFLVALVFSWIFELTPEGLVRDTGQGDHSHATRKLDVATIIAVIALIGFMLWHSSSDRGQVRAPTVADGDRGQEPAPTVATTGQDGLVLGVAVLPFENLSPDPDNAFFASGVHEDVLTFLSRVAELRVISRTSVENYADSQLSLPAIGRELGVSHVVEGSVRRAGDRVRVTVQLIDAATDEHVWAENYDRTLTDIFAIQSEIAQAIVDQVQIELSPEEVEALADLGTDNIDAYDLVIRGRELLNRSVRSSFVAETFLESVELFRRAVALDPGYRTARLALIDACASVIWFGTTEQATGCRTRIEDDIEALRAIAPGSLDVAVAEGIYRYRVQGDNAGAVEVLGPVVAQRPNDLLALTYLALAGRRLQLWDTAIDAIRRTVQIDPANRRWHRLQVEVLHNAARYDEAIAEAEAALRRFPDDAALIERHASLRLIHLGDVADFGRYVRGLDARSRAIRVPYWHYDGVFPSAEAALAWDADADPAGSPIDEWGTRARRAQMEWLAGDRSGPVTELQPMLAGFDQIVAMFGGALQARAFRAELYAMAGHREEALEMREALLREIQDSDDVVIVNSVRSMLARTLAWAGEPEAAWAELEPLIRQPNGPTDWDLVLDPFMQHTLGEVPEYQALVADVEARRR